MRSAVQWLLHAALLIVNDPVDEKCLLVEDSGWSFDISRIKGARSIRVGFARGFCRVLVLRPSKSGHYDGPITIVYERPHVALQSISKAGEHVSDLPKLCATKTLTLVGCLQLTVVADF